MTALPTPTWRSECDRASLTGTQLFGVSEWFNGRMFA
ncbi:hypothetical protein LCGC14_2336150 [marine sediment metagenome]|uniref:Uncharacterized protein n=1 Tax=marine sediment metagenome TaxID=412755 RepID=A0A0F9ER79_9ZZZZ